MTLPIPSAPAAAPMKLSTGTRCHAAGEEATTSPDLFGKLRRHPLVGIDFEDPIAAAGVDPGVAARPLALPGAFDQADR